MAAAEVLCRFLFERGYIGTEYELGAIQDGSETPLDLIPYITVLGGQVHHWNLHGSASYLLSADMGVLDDGQPFPGPGTRGS